MYINKWFTFSASCLVQACSGLGYCFSIYGPALKERLHLSQTQTAFVGSFVNLGGFLAIHAGFLYDRFNDYHRLGPRLVILLGSLCCFLGYFNLYLMITGQVAPHYMALILYAFLAGNTGTWYDTCTLVTNLRNFPNDRGYVVGILKSCLGLSASIYTSLYLALFRPHVGKFLLALALMPPVVTSVLALFINHVPYVEFSELHRPSSWFTPEGRFLMTYLIVGGMALYQMVVALLVAGRGVDEFTRKLATGGMLCVLCLILMVPCQTGPWRSRYGHQYVEVQEEDKTGEEEQGDAREEGWGEPGGCQQEEDTLGGAQAGDQVPLLAVDTMVDGGSGQQGPSMDLHCEHRFEQLNVSEVVRRVDFWLLFICFSTGVGTGLSFLNNLGQLVTSLGGKKDGQVVFVSLFSVANAGGRLLMGYIPEQYLQSKAVPRTFFYVVLMAVMSGTTVFIAMAKVDSLYIAAVLAGLCFGSYWSLAPAIASDIFGLRHFAANYAMLQIAPAVGSYLMATMLSGYLYDAEAARQGGGSECMGPYCFRLTYLILTALNVVSLLCAFWLDQRNHRLYRDIARHLREVQNMEDRLQGEGA